MIEQQQNRIEEAQVAGFIAKTYEILNNQEFNKIIYWTINGKQFAIKDINKFQQIVLPKYFRHKKINSFIRQLNMYGFHKSRAQSTKSIFSHPYFMKGRQDLLKQIKRKIKQCENQLTTPIKIYSTKTLATAVKEYPPNNISIPNQNDHKTNHPEGVQIRQFLQSKQRICSELYLHHPSVKLQSSSIEYFLNEKDDDCLSIQDKIEDLEKRLEIKFENPSYFFFSHQEME